MLTVALENAFDANVAIYEKFSATIDGPIITNPKTKQIRFRQSILEMRCLWFYSIITNLYRYCSVIIATWYFKLFKLFKIQIVY